jgi:nicotinic acid phosphoribosyltransferase
MEDHIFSSNLQKYHVSILDTDLYKLTMQLAICQLYPHISNHYQFINRDGREFPVGFGKRLTEIGQTHGGSKYDNSL